MNRRTFLSMLVAIAAAPFVAAKKRMFRSRWFSKPQETSGARAKSGHFGGSPDPMLTAYPLGTLELSTVQGRRWKRRMDESEAISRLYESRS